MLLHSVWNPHSNVHSSGLLICLRTSYLQSALVTLHRSVIETLFPVTNVAVVLWMTNHSCCPYVRSWPHQRLRGMLESRWSCLLLLVPGTSKPFTSGGCLPRPWAHSPLFRFCPPLPPKWILKNYFLKRKQTKMYFAFLFPRETPPVAFPSRLLPSLLYSVPQSPRLLTQPLTTSNRPLEVSSALRDLSSHEPWKLHASLSPCFLSLRGFETWCLTKGRAWEHPRPCSLPPFSSAFGLWANVHDPSPDSQVSRVFLIRLRGTEMRPLFLPMLDFLILWLVRRVKGSAHMRSDELFLSPPWLPTIFLESKPRTLWVLWECLYFCSYDNLNQLLLRLICFICNGKIVAWNQI